MIYCVEDDAAIRDLMLYTLKSQGFEAQGFGDGEELYEALERQLPELLLLDIMLPGEDGLQILRRLRAQSKTAQLPIIMTTAKGTEYDTIVGLDQGADDYLAKPFGMMEMISRIRAVLRRSTSVSPSVLCVGELVLDPTRHEVTYAHHVIELTPKEFSLLETLMEHPGQVFSREQLFTRVWGMEALGSSRTVDVHIASLRRALGDGASAIETLRGVGYRMVKKELSR